MKVFDNIQVLNSIAISAAKTASANGNAVDTLGFKDGMIVVDGTDIDVSSGNETYVVTVEDSDDGSTGWAAVSGGPTVTITADGQIKEGRLAELNVTTKRYLRAVLTLGGTTPSFLGAVYFVLGGKESGPVGNA